MELLTEELRKTLPPLYSVTGRDCFPLRDRFFSD